jgi:hypothetical protein
VRSRWTGNNPPRFDGAADFQDHGVAIDHGDVDGESHRTVKSRICLTAWGASAAMHGALIAALSVVALRIAPVEFSIHRGGVTIVVLLQQAPDAIDGAIGTFTHRPSRKITVA